MRHRQLERCHRDSGFVVFVCVYGHTCGQRSVFACPAYPPVRDISVQIPTCEGNGIFVGFGAGYAVVSARSRNKPFTLHNSKRNSRASRIAAGRCNVYFQRYGYVAATVICACVGKCVVISAHNVPVAVVWCHT